MDKQSIQKVFAAGFTFYRVRWNELMPIGEIWCASEHGRWSKFEGGFKSKNAAEKRLKEIIQNDPKALAE